MSNFSDFFPAAGGGGGIGKTITVGDYSYVNAQSLDNFAKSRVKYAFTGNQTNNYFELRYDVNSPTTYQTTVSAANTYYTIADITGAVNGGALYGCWGQSRFYTRNSAYFTVRITIDGGTPQEYAFSTGSGTDGSSISYMGKNFVPAGSRNSFDVGASVSQYMLKTLSSEIKPFFGEYDTTSGSYHSDFGNMDASYRVYTSIIPAAICTQEGFPFVYFSDSCKVEIKTDILMTQMSGGAEIINF